MKTLKQVKKYPVIIIFFTILYLLFIADMLAPTRDISQLENRKLAQKPPFTLTSFTSNEWTFKYGEYIRDQFIFRDNWVTAHSIMEAAQGKIESNGVWFARDGYLIARNDGWSTAQATLFPANIDAVCQLAQRHPGKVTTMIVPSPANILSDLLIARPHQVDENAMTDEMLAQMTEAGASVIDLRDRFFAQHQAGEQVFYRTDHHWTTDGGALTAYLTFCELKGLTPQPPPETLRVEVPDFFGTNFAKTRRPFTQQDTLVFYNLPNQMTTHSLQNDGTTQQTVSGLMDLPKLEEYDKYAAFLYGNKGYQEIEGNGEGSILVIKDSYGNSFIPYLIENYARVGVIDLRAWVAVDDTIAQGNYDEILVLYSFAAFSEDAYISRMSSERQAG